MRTAESFVGSHDDSIESVGFKGRQEIARFNDCGRRLIISTWEFQQQNTFQLERCWKEGKEKKVGSDLITKVSIKVQ